MKNSILMFALCKGHLNQVTLISFLPGKLFLITLKHSSNTTSSGKHLLIMILIPHVELIHVLLLCASQALCTHLFPGIYQLIKSLFVSAKGGIPGGQRTASCVFMLN